ncbi:MAG: dihydrodipicolinate synthase family protein [Oscillospiraceae bacterium]|nr:dihydrodipicolinate synthase family protein [Oscillospiraceae bacterium]
MKSIPFGVFPTMVTPFDGNLQVDYPALEPLLRWYEDRNVAGMFAICQSSEIFYLSFDERLRILRELMRLRRPSTVMLASGHTAYDPATQIREAQAFIAEGIDAYVFISNRFAAPAEDEDVFLRRVETVARELGDIPLGLYECPHPYKRLIPPETLRRLTELGNFCFLKDTCCNLEQIRAKLAAAEGTGFRLYNANAATLLESLRMGAAGYSGIMANFHPDIYARLCRVYRDNPAEAERLQNFVGFASLAESQLYPVNAKYNIHQDGVTLGWQCRVTDAAAFTPNRRMEIDQLRAVTKAFLGAGN